MHVVKCDICKKEIKNRGRKVTAGLGWGEKKLCLDCGNPIVKFLLQKQLVTKMEIDKLTA